MATEFIPGRSGAVVTVLDLWSWSTKASWHLSMHMHWQSEDLEMLTYVAIYLNKAGDIETQTCR